MSYPTSYGDIPASTSPMDPSALTGLITGVGIVVVIIVLLLVGYYLFVLWKIFEKAGRPGWAATAPGYNTVILLELVGWPGWIYPLSVGIAYALYLTIFVPVLFTVLITIYGLVIMAGLIILTVKLGNAFGKSKLFSIFVLNGIFTVGFIGAILLAIVPPLGAILILSGAICSVVGYSMLAFGSAQYQGPAMLVNTPPAPPADTPPTPQPPAAE